MAKNGKRLGFLPGWRIFSYVILIFNAVMLIWVIAGANAGHNDKSSCAGLSAKECQDAKDVGTAIGVTALVIIWVLVDIILLVLWLVTNRKKRGCPVCGHDVKKGITVCRNCGHDFRRQYQPQQQFQMQQPYAHQQFPAPSHQPGPPSAYPESSAQRRPGPGPR